MFLFTVLTVSTKENDILNELVSIRSSVHEIKKQIGIPIYHTGIIGITGPMNPRFANYKLPFSCKTPSLRPDAPQTPPKDKFINKKYKNRMNIEWRKYYSTFGDGRPVIPSTPSQDSLGTQDDQTILRWIIGSSGAPTAPMKPLKNQIGKIRRFGLASTKTIPARNYFIRENYEPLIYDHQKLLQASNMHLFSDVIDVNTDVSINPTPSPPKEPFKPK